VTATPTPAAGRRPRFSLISAVYNVDRYLPDFIASIEKQTFPLDRVQVIIVDDGSTDESLTTLKEWSARRPDLVTVLTKENGGQGSARNLGLEHALGEWISFPDPDDLLEADYLQRVDEFLTRHSTVAMAASSRQMFDERTGQIRNTHPLRRMFHVGDQVVDADRIPDFFHGSAPSGFYRAEVIEREQLRFDLRVRPNFEDGHFSCHYLLAVDRPMIGFVATAHYLYRKRADRTSTLQTSLLDPDRYVAVPRHGYLDVLRFATERKGAVPEWLQNFLLYELSFYFAVETRISDVASAAHGEVAEEFVRTLAEIAELLTPAAVESFGLARFDPVWRDILLHSLKGEKWATPYVVITRVDETRNRMQIAYRYCGERPAETIVYRGRQIEPSDAKVRAHDYWDHTLLRERLMWVPTNGGVRVFLEGKAVEFRNDWAEQHLTTLRPAARQRLLTGGTAKREPRLKLRDRVVRRLARTRPVRRVFGDAWVLLDRLHNADDNAERLYRYLRTHRRDVNAWFTLEKGTPDWQRLRKDGYRRSVPYGSLRWELLMLNCKNLISSQADVPVVRPPRILKYGDPTWRFVFLQHGVIKDDISRWLNLKKIDLFVTSTPGEHESIVGDDSPYAFTTYEVKMTGLARFDRLLELGNKIAPEQRKYILVCPTWRQWLSQPKEIGSHRRTVTEMFFDSEFAQQWLGFLRDERLRALAERSGLTIGFLPHPNLQAALADLDLPSYVKPLSFEGQDVQEMFAEAAVVVTDYSSMAFNAGYIERPVVYFQFDAALVLGGGHTGRYGYYDYRDDGFGPVAETIDATVDAVEQTLANGRAPAPEYLKRIRETFPQRDGRCCERTVAAIEALDRPFK
jgi:glycosyltransferase involved in cell wall biosynthesis